MALTDKNGFYGVVRAHVKARELGIRLIIGSQLTVEDGTTIVLLAQNRQGYANLCDLISDGCLRSVKGECSVRWEEIHRHSKGVIALWGGDQSLITSENYSQQVGEGLSAAFNDRLYALVTRHCTAREVSREKALRERAETLGIPCVAGVEILYHTPERRPLQDIMTCIQHRTTVSSAGCLLKPNSEHYLKSPAEMSVLFSDKPEELCRANDVAARCSFTLDEIRYRYPSEMLPDGMKSSEYLREQTFAGANKCYGGCIPDDVISQLHKELKLIDELDYCGYFLTMWKIVQFCRQNNILCQGRGSAANSIVCYCLGITAVDPVRLGLLFERFISKERAEPPDIDLDIEHNRREEVIQYVYAHYGRTHAAMVATVIRYRKRSAIRDVGKALGLPETAIDRFAKAVEYSKTAELALEQAGFNPRLTIHKKFLGLVNEIADFPRHLSIHPGGFLLGHEPVRHIVPIENGAMDDRTVIQWDKNDIEELGLFKVDLLGLGALTHLHLSFDLIMRHYCVHHTMASIPKADPATFHMICDADTVGVFQIESRAQMSMLPRLKPRDYYDLVIQISIVRPGPIVGGMVHPYLRRRNDEEPIDYPHPSLVPVLQKTLGIPLFQEQVMRIAMVAADYTPGEADQLRRDMAAWKRSGRIERHHERLINRMQKKGISKEFAERVFQQISGFGEYGFPESHAASFALIAYATAWVKCHYPDVFVCALLNALPMGFYSASTIIDDAKRHGVGLLPIDVRNSEWECTLEAVDAKSLTRQEKQRLKTDNHGCATSELSHRNRCTYKQEKDRDHSWIQQRCGLTAKFAVRIGFKFVKGLGKHHWERIQNTKIHSPFRSQKDFAERTQLDQKALAALAQAGAFEGFNPCRRSSLWDASGFLEPANIGKLFDEHEDIPTFEPLRPLESIFWDYQAMNQSTRGHPLEPLRDLLSKQNLPPASVVMGMEDGAWTRYAGITICRQSPMTASGVVFMTLEDETGFVNIIVWPKIFEQYKRIVKTMTFLGVTGQVQSQDSVVHLVAKKLWVPRLKLNPLNIKSRNFM